MNKLFLGVGLLGIFSSFIGKTNGNAEETYLREYLFETYDKDIRPVMDHNTPLNCYMGMAIQNLEEFNQMTETAKLNVWIRNQWVDETLSWDNNISTLSYISITDELWVPDIEFLNAAGLPEVYVLNGGMYLYPDGLVIYSKPQILKFSCSMDLHEFPFDIQSCKLRFGSWLYSDQFLHLMPFSEESKRIDILDSFSHSEWEVLGVNVTTTKQVRNCCPNKLFDLLEYEIRLQRYPHYYKLSMGMTIALVIVSFIIMLMNPDNISRTSTAVFIPLTILALQLTIADKIPVVGYYTLMDSFFLCCFITSMIVSIESGIIYSLLTTNSKIVYRIFEPLFDIKVLKEAMDNKIQKEKEYKESHDSEIRNLNKTDRDQEQSNSEFNQVIDSLKKLDSSSSTDNKISEEEDNLDSKSTHSYSSNYSRIISNKTVRTIDYNDRLLQLTYKEKLIFDRISYWVKIADNIFRVLLPIIFFSYIGSLYSYEK